MRLRCWILVPKAQGSVPGSPCPWQSQDCMQFRFGISLATSCRLWPQPQPDCPAPRTQVNAPPCRQCPASLCRCGALREWGGAGEDAPSPCSAHPAPPVLSMPAGLSHFHHAGLSCSFPTATRAGPFLLVSLPAALTRSGCCPPVRL